MADEKEETRTVTITGLDDTYEMEMATMIQSEGFWLSITNKRTYETFEEMFPTKACIALTKSAFEPQYVIEDLAQMFDDALTKKTKLLMVNGQLVHGKGEAPVERIILTLRWSVHKRTRTAEFHLLKKTQNSLDLVSLRLGDVERYQIGEQSTLCREFESMELRMKLVEEKKTYSRIWYMERDYDGTSGADVLIAIPGGLGARKQYCIDINVMSTGQVWTTNAGYHRWTIMINDKSVWPDFGSRGNSDGSGTPGDKNFKFADTLVSTTNWTGVRTGREIGTITIKKSAGGFTCIHKGTMIRITEL